MESSSWEYSNISCTITVSRRQSKEEGTCSGILFDTKHGIVLSHASVLSSVLKENTKILKEVNENSFCSSKQELSSLDVEVLLPHASFSENGDFDVFKLSKLRTSLLNSLQEEQTLYEKSVNKFTGSVICVFQVWNLKKILKTLMPKDTWEYVEELTPLDQNKKKSTGSDFHQYMPCFILIKIHDWSPYSRSLPTKSSGQNHVGDPVEILATPFGNLNVDVFQNSRSRGIISNLTGKNQVLILTDARCIPGSEGGALFFCHGKFRTLTGVIIASLCWKNNEWVGLSLACAISEIITAIKNLPMKIGQPTSQSAILWSLNLPVQKMMEAILYVTLHGNWGTGVRIGHRDGDEIILTCSHVVKESKIGQVYVKSGTDEKCAAKVVYQTAANQHFDLAVLSSKLTQSMEFYPQCGSAVEGEPVFVLGYAVFGEQHRLDPTVTYGIVSKVIRIDGIPIMIQTTCGVHAGVSGGPVINRNGQIVGITVCNAKDSDSGASYPHVNMSVPMETIYPVLRKYINSGEEKVLEQLHLAGLAIKQLWSLNVSDTGSRKDKTLSRL